MFTKDFMMEDQVVEGGGRRLRVRLPSNCAVMDYQVDMIQNNRIDGLMPFKVITSDGKPCFFYDTDGLEPLPEYVAAHGLDLRSCVEVLLGVASTAGSLDRYLLSEVCLLIEYERVYIDADSKAARLVYLPVDQLEAGRGRFIAFALDIIGKTRVERSTEKLFCRKIVDELKKSGFRYDAFCNFLMDLLCFSDEQPDAGFGAQAGGGAGFAYPQAAAAGIAGMAGMAPAPATGSQNSPALKNGRNSAPWAAAQLRRDPRAKAAALGGKAKNPAEAAISPEQEPDARGGMRLPLLAAGGIAVAYFAALSFLPADGGDAIKSAALLAAVGAELFVLTRFMPKGAVRVLDACAQSDAGRPAKGSPGGSGKREEARDAKTAGGKKKRDGGKAASKGGSFARAVRDAADLRGRAAERGGAVAPQCEGAGADLWAQSVSDAMQEKPDGPPDQAAAEPAIAEPATAEHTASAPATAEPATAEPVTVEPPTAEPTTAAPAAAESVIAEPPAAEPVTAAPAAAESVIAEHTATAEPATVEPVIEEPVTAEPTTAEPATVEPVIEEPVTAEPATAEPAAAEPASVGLEMPGTVGEALPREPQAQPCIPAEMPMPPLEPQRFSASAEETQVLASRMPIEATLYVRGETRECGVVLKGKPFVIGRLKDRSDLVFDNRAVGKVHAMIEREGDAWLLTDLDSRNGTYVNNIRLEPRAAKPLRNYDLVTVANVDMVFMLAT